MRRSHALVNRQVHREKSLLSLSFHVGLMILTLLIVMIGCLDDESSSHDWILPSRTPTTFPTPSPTIRTTVTMTPTITPTWTSTPTATPTPTAMGITFCHSFGRSPSFGNDVQQTSDRGYILTGTSPLTDYGVPDIFLLKTDEYGREIWFRTFGAEREEEGAAVNQTADGGYIIVGQTHSFGAGKSDIYLIKTDAEGILEWSQTFGTEEDETATSVAVCPDGGFLIGGQIRYSSPSFWSHFLAIKTDPIGNLEWIRNFPESCQANIALAENRGSILAHYICRDDEQNSSVKGIRLTRLNSDGDEQWTTSVTEECMYPPIVVSLTNAEGFMIYGAHTVYLADNYTTINVIDIIKADIQGALLWHHKSFFNDYRDSWVSSAGPTLDGGHILVGNTTTPAGLFLLKTDDTGNQLWLRIDPFDLSSISSGKIRQTDDRGYVLVGDGSRPDVGRQIVLIKTDPYGHVDTTDNTNGVRPVLLTFGP